jgi:hypothetical protein
MTTYTHSNYCAMDAWRRGNDAGDGFAPDDSTAEMTPRQAAEAAEMTHIRQIDPEGAVIAWDVYRWVVIADSNGPWAVAVSGEQ